MTEIVLNFINLMINKLIIFIITISIINSKILLIFIFLNRNLILKNFEDRY